MRVAVGLERFGLPPAAVEREHEMRHQLLARRVLRDEVLQLGHHVGVASGREVGLHARLQRRETLLFQSRDLGAGEGLGYEVGERRSPP